VTQGTKVTQDTLVTQVTPDTKVTQIILVTYFITNTAFRFPVDEVKAAQKKAQKHTWVTKKNNDADFPSNRSLNRRDTYSNIEQCVI